MIVVYDSGVPLECDAGCHDDHVALRRKRLVCERSGQHCVVLTGCMLVERRSVHQSIADTLEARVHIDCARSDERRERAHGRISLCHDRRHVWRMHDEHRTLVSVGLSHETQWNGETDTNHECSKAQKHDCDGALCSLHCACGRRRLRNSTFGTDLRGRHARSGSSARDVRTRHP